MQAFSFRDYVVGVLIILGVLAAWFFIMAGLFGLVDAQISLPLAVIISVVIYIVIKQHRPKE